MIIRVNRATASLLKELCEREILDCVDMIRSKRQAATGNYWDRSENVALLFENRVHCLIDFLDELDHASKL